MIPFKFALRRRIAASHTKPWTLFHSGQWGTGTEKTITVSFTEGQAIQFRYNFHSDDNTFANSRTIRYELYNGTTRVLREEYTARTSATTIYAPSNITKVIVRSEVTRPNSSYSTTMKCDAYYRVI